MIENLSIIIVTWRRDDLLEGCLRSLYNVYSLKPEIVVVDNGGASTTRRLCAQYKNVKYISSAVNLGYAGGNVVGLKYCTRDFVLLLNNDTIVHSDSFSPLMDFLVENKNVGVVQGTMNRPFYGNTLDACGYYMNWFGALREYHINEPTSSEIGTYKCVAVKGAMLMFPRNLLKSVVGPLFYPHFVCNYEEVDFCLRVQKAGYECYYVPTEPIDHLCGQSLAMVKSSAMKKRSLANGMFSFFTLFPMAKGCIFVLFMMARAIRELLLGRAEAMVVFCGAFRITFRERNRILVTRHRFVGTKHGKKWQREFSKWLLLIKVSVGEFMRYVIVGGIAFLADFGTLVAIQEILFANWRHGVYIATIAGFVVGLAVNYALSLWFVFTQKKDQCKGRSVGAFIVFGVIGLLGLLWTELGMWLGVEILAWNYMVVKVFVTGAVLVWNYLGRKLLIFNSKESQIK